MFAASSKDAGNNVTPETSQKKRTPGRPAKDEKDLASKGGIRAYFAPPVRDFIVEQARKNNMSISQYINDICHREMLRQQEIGGSELERFEKWLRKHTRNEGADPALKELSDIMRAFFKRLHMDET